MTQEPLPTTASPAAKALAAAIDDRSATVAIVGLGYVGLPLVEAVHDAGFRVIGFDTDSTKIDRLRAGESYLNHLGGDLVRRLAASDRFNATATEADLSSADIVLLCVPTPLGDHREPDLTYVHSSARTVSSHLDATGGLAKLVVLESTTYPGTTRDELSPILARTDDNREASDVFVAYSPEREDPGRPGVRTAQIPKLVGGLNPVGTALAARFYSTVVDTVYAVDSAEIAEAAKLLENIYRAVNIALVNELKVVFDAMGINIWSVIDAAKTKPFGFQAFYPGPGLGGHCIPIDPFYLAWKAKSVGRGARFIELAGEINSAMPLHVVTRLAEGLNDDAKPIRDADILVIGIAYKPNVDDVRETPAAEIIRLLLNRGARVSYHDPHVAQFPAMRRYRFNLASEPLTPKRLAEADAVLIVTHHDAIDWAAIGAHAKLVIDTRNVIPEHATARVVRA